MLLLSTDIPFTEKLLIVRALTHSSLATLNEVVGEDEAVGKDEVGLNEGNNVEGLRVGFDVVGGVGEEEPENSQHSPSEQLLLWHSALELHKRPFLVGRVG